MTKKSKKDNIDRKIIKLTVYDDTEFVSPYSFNSNEIISEDVAKFIETSALELKYNDKIQINIYSNSIIEEEEHIYARAIKNYYRNKIKENDRDIKHKNVQSSLMFLTGVIIFFINLLINNLIQIPVLSEILTIAYWVLLWEAVFMFFSSYEYKQLKKRYTNLINANIKFVKLDKKVRK